MKWKTCLTAFVVTIMVGLFCTFSDNEKCKKERESFVSNNNIYKTNYYLPFCPSFDGVCYAYDGKSFIPYDGDVYYNGNLPGRSMRMIWV